MRVALLALLLIALAVLTVVAVSRDGSPPSGADGRVTLFHETHTHGELARFPRYVGLRNARADRGASLFLGNGDDLSLFSGDVYTDGRHTIDAFNAAGLDANTFGFSEMDFSLDRLRELVAASRFTWVSANVRDRDDDVLAAEQGARRWIVEDVGGVRVGVTGVLGTRFTHERPPRTAYGPAGEIRVLDPARALSEVVPQMRDAGADVVVVLSHMIHEDTLRVVDVVPGIDVALGTHLGPPTLRPDMVGATIVAVAGPADLEALGELELTMRDGRVVRHSFRRHVPLENDAADRAVEEVLARYR